MINLIIISGVLYLVRCGFELLNDNFSVSPILTRVMGLIAVSHFVEWYAQLDPILRSSYLMYCVTFLYTLFVLRFSYEKNARDAYFR